MVRLSAILQGSKRQDKVTSTQQKVELYKFFDKQWRKEQRKVMRAEKRKKKETEALWKEERIQQEIEAGSKEERRAMRSKMRDARFGEDGDDFQELFNDPGLKFSAAAANYKPRPRQPPCWWKSAWGILPGAERFADMSNVDGVLAAVDQRRIDTKAPFLYQHYLEKCIEARALAQGRAIHAHIVKSGLSKDRNFANLLVQMYGACGRIDDALQVFSSIAYKNTRSYASMIAAYSEHGEHRKALDLVHRMETIPRDDFILITALHCAARLRSLDDGKAIHKWITDEDLVPDLALSNAIIDMYAQCRDMATATQLFTAMPARNSATWSVMISGHIHNGEPEEGIKLYKRVQHGVHRVDLTAAALVLLVRSCRELGLLQEARDLHASLNNRELGYPSVAGALMEMYAEAGVVDQARSLFDKLPKRDLIAWNAMIAAYARSGHPRQACDLYEELLRCEEPELRPDKSTYVAMLEAYGDIRDVEQGHRIEKLLVQAGNDPGIQSALLGFYGKCGAIQAARAVFDRLRHRDAACWTAMINAYVTSGDARGGIELFREMSVDPIAETYSIVLSACSIAGDLAAGKAVDQEISRSAFKSDVGVQNALMSMYARVGQLTYVKWEFDRMGSRNSESWNIVLGAYAHHGHARQALDLFPGMHLEGVAPDGITFIAILSCCSRLGVIEDGWERFVSMTADFAIAPWLQHYRCMIELLGRAGKLDLAEELVRTMPFEAGQEEWSALMETARASGDAKRSARAAYRAADLAAERQAEIRVLAAS